MALGLFVTLGGNRARRRVFVSMVGKEVFVRDQLQRYRDEFGAAEFRFRRAWRGLPQAEIIANIRRVGRIVAHL